MLLTNYKNHKVNDILLIYNSLLRIIQFKSVPYINKKFSVYTILKSFKCQPNRVLHYETFIENLKPLNIVINSNKFKLLYGKYFI